ncbi:MAG: alpha-xylosidase [Clostridiales bacterium]|nr:alpha-xylosidase [Clostridiales bacterium]
MKFTNGYWLIRPNYTMSYATQWVRTVSKENELHVLSACRPVRNRGDVLDGGSLDVTFTAPRENVIRVKVTHFAGKRDNAPHFETYEEPVTPVVEENEESVSFTSGALTAKVSKGEAGWQVDYIADGRVLTTSGFRAMGRGLDKDTGKSYMSESLMLDVGEYVYGLGERFSAYVKNGQSIDMWNADGGTASEQAYKNIPFYMTNRGYGVFVEDTSDVSFEVASEKVERVQFSAEGETLVYDIIYGGTPKKVLDIYTALTGRPALLPAWSFGLWLSTSFTTNYDEATAVSFVEGMAKRDIPLRVFHFDCFWMKGYNWCDFEWDPDTFPDPVGMLKRYHERGLQVCCWINPYIGQASPLFKEGMDNGYLIQKTNGDVWQTDLWQAGMGIVDVTNPAARDWYCGYLRKLLDMGVDCFKTDFGERIPVKDIAYHDGKSALHMHNYYTFLYNKMVFDLLKEVRGEGEAILFARSATAGGQQFPVHWGGDNSASYVSMAETLRAGLSLSHSGFGYWSHDISGFESTAPADVYKRWCAFGLLSSHSRLHGSSSYRVPWLFDEESNDVVRLFSKLKNRLMPYLYNAAVEAHECGTPMMRPMMLEFPEDPACDTLDRQYMLGENLLVAPVFREDGVVDFYLPDGVWTNILDDHKVDGGHWRKETHNFLSLPLMARPGSVIPMGAHDDLPDYDYTDGLELHVFQLVEGNSVVVKVPDLKGKLAAAYTVKKENGNIIVETDSTKPYTVVEHS